MGVTPAEPRVLRGGDDGGGECCLASCCNFFSGRGDQRSDPGIPMGNIQQTTQQSPPGRTMTVTTTKDGRSQKVTFSEGSRVEFGYGTRRLRGTVRGFDGSKARVQSDGDAQGLLTLVPVTDLQPA